MSINKKPFLEPYSGRLSRHVCPGCKQKQSFTLYIDGNTNKPIHRSVGRCNREISCGYHYSPREYFRDNPENGLSYKLRNNPLSGKYQSKNNRDSILNPNFNIDTKPLSDKTEFLFENKNSAIDYIPKKYLVNSASYNSNFVCFLCNYFPREKIEEAVQEYALGATRNKSVIYWQIDIKGKVRTGKIMQYNPETGKRVKNRAGSINWVHSILKRRNPTFANFNLCQCYFGEHLLRLYPDKPVAIVEGEKTAVIGSIIYKEFNWLAAGNLNGLSVSKSEVLKDKYVMLYPDAGCMEKWTRKMKDISSKIPAKVTVSELIEKHATTKQLEYGYDLADYIIDNTKNETLRKMIEINPALQTLIDEFGLEEVK